MRPIIAVLLLALFSSALVRPVLSYVEYWANQDFIADVLCINKDKPQMQCNGQCHLSAQLEKATDSEESDAQNTPSTRSIAELFPVTLDSSTALVPRSATLQLFPGYTIAPSERAVRVLTPPPERC